MKYVGRDPVSDFAVVTKNDADTRYTAVSVTDTWLQDATDDVSTDLVTPGYVNTQDGFRATKTAVDAADAGYLLATTLGATNGVASLGADGDIPTAQLPALNTQRKFGFKNVDTIFLSSGTHTVTTTATREYEAARLTIADPGFPYIPLPFCVIRGGSTAAADPASFNVGTGNYGQVTILDPALVKYGWTITTGQKGLRPFVALPFADSTVNPTSRPPVTGALTLSVWLACWSGSTYTFDSAGLQFYCLIMPGV